MVNKRKPKKLTKAERIKRRQHFYVYLLLGVAVLGVQYQFPAILNAIFGSAIDLSKNLEMLATEGTTGLLAIAGLIYTWKKVFK